MTWAGSQADHITCRNCTALLGIAKGGQAEWRPLFDACVSFAADHISELSKDSLLEVDLVSLSAILEATAPRFVCEFLAWVSFARGGSASEG